MDVMEQFGRMDVMEQKEQKEQVPKMTVTRALVELKTLDKRINRAVAECDLVKVRLREHKWDVGQFTRQAQAAFQSATDLITRRDELKARILRSNARTKVAIGKDTYTVAEVIDKKQSLKYRESLLEKLRGQKAQADETFNVKNEEMKQKLDRLLEINFGKEGKSNAENVETISKSYFDTNKVELVDPVNIAKKIKDLEEHITEFDKEADLILSESNARTYIDL
jgi:hypothetical protein